MTRILVLVEIIFRPDNVALNVSSIEHKRKMEFDVRCTLRSSKSKPCSCRRASEEPGFLRSLWSRKEGTKKQRAIIFWVFWFVHTQTLCIQRESPIGWSIFAEVFVYSPRARVKKKKQPDVAAEGQILFWRHVRRAVSFFELCPRTYTRTEEKTKVTFWG